MFGSERGTEHLGARHAFGNQRTGHVESALGRQLQVVLEMQVAFLDRAVVGEATDHEHLARLAQIQLQGWHQTLKQQTAFVAQRVGVQIKQHAAADADAAVVERDATGLQRNGKRLLQGHAARFFLMPFLNLGLQAGDEIHLHGQHRNQDEHKCAHHTRHQVAEHRPHRRGLLHAIVFAAGAGIELCTDHAALPTVVALDLLAPRKRRRSSTMPCCELMLRSITSRACAT